MFHQAGTEKNKSRGEHEKRVGIAGFPRGFKGPFITDSLRGINYMTADYGTVIVKQM